MRVQLIVGGVWMLVAGTIGCTKNEPGEPVANDPYVGIDPDQKALPKDLPSEPAKSVSDATLQGDGRTIVEGDPTHDARVNAPLTPPDGSSPIPPPAEPTLTPSADATNVSNDTTGVSSTGPRVVGNGPETRFIKAWELNIRSQPNRFSKIVGRLNGGDEVHVSIHGGWAKLEDGRWIRSRWLVKSRPRKFVGGPGEINYEERPVKKQKQVKKSKRRKRRSSGSKT